MFHQKINLMYTWLGRSDLMACRPNDIKKGPVADALLGMASEEAIHQVVLLHDCREDEADTRSAYVVWLEGLLAENGLDIQVVSIPILKHKGDDPTSYNWVYDKMRQHIKAHERTQQENDGRIVGQRCYLVGPGTPTMGACTILISRLKEYAGSLWQADERHDSKKVRPLELPVVLRLEDGPDPRATHAQRYQRASDVSVAAVVCSPSTRQVWAAGERAAHTNWPVLILGSTGTGKEELAKHIHHCTGLHMSKLYSVNCGAIPAELIESTLFGHAKGSFTGATKDQKGIFETAEDGTVFLDEIGELPLTAQVKFLRVLQEKKVTPLGKHTDTPVHCRIIAATHRQLWQAVEKGQFRADLYYRIAGIILELADLSQRREDLEQMIERFWQQIVTEHPGFPGRTLDEDARRELMAHTWPGNVRELKTTLVRAAFWAKHADVSASDIKAALGQHTSPHAPQVLTLPMRVHQSDLSLKRHTQALTKELVCEALKCSHNKKSEAARLMDITPQHLGRLCKQFDISKP